MTFARNYAEHRERREAEKAASMRVLATTRLRPHTTGPAVTKADPKSEPKRNRALLDMAEGRRCLLCVPGTCTCTPGSTVAAHSNLSIHGKAGARKADDCYSVWAGDKAHEWLDRSGAPAEEKLARFMAAHLRQVLEWRLIAQDATEPERFRKAALWALNELEAV